ncbi:hypothetical protein O181_023061 [Austropuccinia psidii MF-1]|uniref:Uncharacterized protein n=1 Tax=Austropuccinia psidii MF-1 TaxID=1389203 RepID=A0A9Q3CE42_9BASI|nr:hypothetical protein [Austropuccinia psidii MF-1]
MSPSPARTKPPPSHLASLMNPTPDPPEENDHMIIPEVYQSEPGFLTQTQNEAHSSILSIILQKIENLEKKETNMILPTAMTTLITKLNDQIDDLTEKQFSMEKVINDLLTKLDNTHKQQTTTNNTVSPPLPKSPQASAPLSFATIAATPTSTNDTSLPKQPPQAACLNRTQEQNQFKKFHIVIRTQISAPKPFEKTTPQEACNRINKALMDINGNCDNTPIRIKALTRYPSGDIKLYTKSRAEARWLLENRAG